MRINFKKLLSSKAKVATLGVLIVLGAVILLFPQPAMGMGSISDAVTEGLGRLLLILVNFLGSYILLPLINLVIWILSYNDFLNSYAVQIGWPLVRDISNMFFVVLLLVIAFSTILKISNYQYKNTLAKLILMAILVNFSKTIMGLLIDFGQVIMLTFVNAFRDAAASNLIHAFGIKDMLKINLAQGTDINNWAILGTVLLAVVLLVVAIGVMLAFVAVLLMRILYLWILVILSPLAFLLSAFPMGAKYASEFWSNFWKQLTTGVALSFFLWLALTVLSASGQDQTAAAALLSGETGSPAGTAAERQEVGGNITISEDMEWERLYVFIIAIALLLLALQYAGQAGGFAGAFAGKVSGKLSQVGAKVAGAPFKGAWGLAKSPFSYAARMYSEKMPGWANPAALIRGFKERREELHKHARDVATGRGRRAVEQFQTGKWKKVFLPQYWNWAMGGAMTRKEMENTGNQKVETQLPERVNGEILRNASDETIKAMAGFSQERDKRTDEVINRIKTKEKRPVLPEEAADIRSAIEAELISEAREGKFKKEEITAAARAKLDPESLQKIEAEVRAKVKVEVEAEIKRDIKVRLIPSYADIPYDDQVEESLEAQYAKDFRLMSKEEMARQAILLKDMGGVDGERKRRSLVRVATSKGYLDDIIASKRVREAYGYKGKHNHKIVNHFLHSYVGFNKDGSINKQGQRTINDIEDIGKDVTHTEYGGHNIFNPQTGKFTPNLYFKPGEKFDPSQVVTAEMAKKNGWGTGIDARNKALSEHNKLGKRNQVTQSPHVYMPLFLREGFDKNSKKVEGFFADAVDIDSFEFNAAINSFKGQDPKRYKEQLQPRTANMFIGGLAHESNIDEQGFAHVVTDDVQRIASYNHTDPELVKGFYEKAGGEGEIKLQLHVANEQEIEDLISNLSHIIKPVDVESIREDLVANFDSDKGVIQIDPLLFTKLSGRAAPQESTSTAPTPEKPLSSKEVQKAQKLVEAIENLEKAIREASSPDEVSASTSKRDKIITNQVFPRMRLAVNASLNHPDIFGQRTWLDTASGKKRFIEILKDQLRIAASGNEQLTRIMEKEMESNFTNLGKEIDKDQVTDFIFKFGNKPPSS